MKGTYYRWTRARASVTNGTDESFTADILGTDTEITARPDTGLVYAKIPDRGLSPDEARMIGVRLIEGATLADAHRSVREP